MFVLVIERATIYETGTRNSTDGPRKKMDQSWKRNGRLNRGELWSSRYPQERRSKTVPARMKDDSCRVGSEI
jgi:hypothetical protein